MLTPPDPFWLRAMQLADIPAVREVDRLSFPTPARAGLFEHELDGNKIAHYQVLGVAETIIGFAGFWLIADEVHVSTIATHPTWRGRGLGELLLLNLLFQAYTLPATMVTLEVRHSNKVAQALYHKYQFAEVGSRPRYYRDTGEDALLMTVPLLNARYHQFLENQQVKLLQRLQSEA
ncbi:ribosomal protein S18-alanine N-acetyltransferase [Candidatus Leptofilum sp.]|uniref:ribosomal protein S18-alanine N-acetyltransferase n=1 Tax=Candidatus Leptofilum sp. TaxID=3241576 RepID=UPI003B59F59B